MIDLVVRVEHLIVLGCCFTVPVDENF